MSDPIEKLTRLGDAMEGAPMPLPASEIRARGDRIRRRKHAAVAGASAAVVAAVALPVVAFTIGDDAPDRLAPEPTVTDPVETGAIGESNLLTSKDAIYPTGGFVDWRERMTVEGDGQAAYSPCMQQSMAGLGAESVWQRDFNFVVTESKEVDPTNHLNEIIAEFPSTADAEAAYAEIRSWYDDCLPPGADRYDAGTFAPVAIDVDGQAEAQLSTYKPVDESLDPTGDLGYFLETGLVLSGERVAVLSQVIVGQDYNFGLDDRPVVRMLPAAAERLVLGNGGSEPDGQTVEGDGVTAIPGDFPLMDGWPESDGSDEFQLDEPSIDNQAMVAAGDLPDCGQSADGGEPVDRLTTRIGWGSAYYARELQLFASPDDAAAFLDSLQDASSACADQAGSPYEVESFDGSNLVVTSAEGVGRQVVMASQVDNAVLVAIQSDEGGGSEGVDQLWTEVGENLAGVRVALDELLGGRPGTDPATPSADTAIPDDLPIDVDMADMSGDGGEYRMPYHPPATEQGVTVDLCGQQVWPAEGTADQLWTWATGPEYGDRRELVTFPTVDEAVGAVAAIRDGLQDCPGEGTTVWTVSDVDTGYDSVTFHRTYTRGLGHDAFQVTRVGNAVLLTLSYGEGNLSSIGYTDPVRTELTRTIAPSLCNFTEAGCL